MLVKVIPFLLVMWMLTGAIYPAIDMTAGEKERGTMETLLISPAERTEIVAGKFLAVDGAGVRHGGVERAADGRRGGGGAGVLPVPAAVARPGWRRASLAALPLAMLFAAGCLTLGVFARSTKEGNYYMVPMFFVVLPLAYWSMTPGIELDAPTSWVPVTNALLLQQRLMAVRPDPFPWQHVPAVVDLAGGVHRGWRCGRRCGSSTARRCCSARPSRAGGRSAVRPAGGQGRTVFVGRVEALRGPTRGAGASAGDRERNPRGFGSRSGRLPSGAPRRASQSLDPTYENRPTSSANAARNRVSTAPGTGYVRDRPGATANSRTATNPNPVPHRMSSVTGPASRRS